MLSKLMILTAILLAAPLFLGLLFTYELEEAPFRRLCLSWVGGQVFLWAIFYCISVPMIIKNMAFHSVVNLYLGIIVVLVLGILVIEIWSKKNKKFDVFLNKKGEKLSLINTKSFDLFSAFMLLLVLGFIVFQLIMAICYSYNDGDDAFYVAVSGLANSSDTMYMIEEYRGGATGLTSRYALAPFPIWIAFLARISNVETVVLARTILPPVLILMTYAIYYLIGNSLIDTLGDKYKSKSYLIYAYMLFVEVLILFGDYSYFSVEHFLIARSRQGKAAMGNIIIPVIVFLSLKIFAEYSREATKDNRAEKALIKESRLNLYLLLVFSVLSGCLCSTLSTFLLCMFLGILGIVSAIVYKKVKPLIAFAVCAMPCLVVAIIYFFI